MECHPAREFPRHDIHCSRAPGKQLGRRFVRTGGAGRGFRLAQNGGHGGPDFTKRLVPIGVGGGGQGGRSSKAARIFHNHEEIRRELPREIFQSRHAICGGRFHAVRLRTTKLMPEFDTLPDKPVPKDNLPISAALF
jgi:hypothetical protein